MLAVLHDELAELSGLGLRVLVCQVGNFHVRVERILIFVHLERFDVLLKGLDALIDLGLEPLVLLVYPGVLVGQLLLVFPVGCLRHAVGLDRHFKVHLLVALEEVRHELLLELGNLLEGNETIFVSLQDREDDIVGLVAVNDLVRLIEDQVDLEERELLLLGSNCLDLFLGVVLVFHFARAVDLCADGQEPVHSIDVVLD